MPVRITSSSTKIAYVVVCYVIGIFAAIVAAAALALPAGNILMAALVLLAVAFAARVFRGEDEKVSKQRPWWKMTAHSTSGFVFAVLFGLQVSYLVSIAVSSSEGVPIVGLLVNAVIAVMFVNSSLRLRAAERLAAPIKK